MLLNFSIWWPGGRRPTAVHLSADMRACNLMLQSHGELDNWRQSIVRTGRNTSSSSPAGGSTLVSRDQHLCLCTYVLFVRNNTRESRELSTSRVAGPAGPGTGRYIVYSYLTSRTPPAAAWSATGRRGTALHLLINPPPRIGHVSTWFVTTPIHEDTGTRHTGGARKLTGRCWSPMSPPNPDIPAVHPHRHDNVVVSS